MTLTIYSKFNSKIQGLYMPVNTSGIEVYPDLLESKFVFLPRGSMFKKKAKQRAREQ
jgi:hypothetical protein